jgi:ribosomal protein S12 methylthiotransferase accessory factor YcaO
MSLVAPPRDPGPALERAVREIARSRLEQARGANGNAAGSELVARGRRLSLRALLERAQEAGEVRSDVTSDELLASLVALLDGHVPAVPAGVDPAAQAGLVSQVFLDAAGYRPFDRDRSSHPGARRWHR